jgi:hypothetical protein
VLVNSAGIIRLAPFLETTDELWSHVLGVNLTGMFIVATEREFFSTERTGPLALGQPCRPPQQNHRRQWPPA